MDIRLDYTNMMASAVGEEHGIREEELEALRPKAEEIHQHLMKRRPVTIRPDGVVNSHDPPTVGHIVQQRLAQYLLNGLGGVAVLAKLRPGHVRFGRRNPRA